jgi:hypothetical protein
MTAHGRWPLQQRLLAAVRRVTPTKALGYRRPVTCTHAGQSSPNRWACSPPSTANLTDRRRPPGRTARIDRSDKGSASVSNTRRSRTARTMDASTAGDGERVWTADKIRLQIRSTSSTDEAEQ